MLPNQEESVQISRWENCDRNIHLQKKIHQIDINKGRKQKTQVCTEHSLPIGVNTISSEKQRNRHCWECRRNLVNFCIYSKKKKKFSNKDKDSKMKFLTLDDHEIPAFPLHTFPSPPVGNGIKKELSFSSQLMTAKEQTNSK